MAKTAWNYIIVADADGGKETKSMQRLAEAQKWLDLARTIFDVIGPEGDKDGPQQEIQVLQELLSV